MNAVDTTLRQHELALAKKLLATEFMSSMGMKMTGASRVSDRDYDVSLIGDKFKLWLPLWAIRELVVWTSAEVASLTDHPEMVMEGDWSGVRDSRPEAVWEIFERYVIVGNQQVR